MSDPLTQKMLQEKLIAAHKRYSPWRLPYDRAVGNFIDHVYDIGSRVFAAYFFVSAVGVLAVRFYCQLDDMMSLIRLNQGNSVLVASYLVLGALFIWFRPPTVQRVNHFLDHLEWFIKFRSAFKALERNYFQARKATARSRREQKGRCAYE